MAEYNMNQIKENLDKMIAYEICGDENGKSKEIDTNIFLVDKELDSWSFSRLNSYYEKGIGENTVFSLPEIHALVVGFALIIRYNLSLREYTDWCKKQDEIYIYNLLKLVGIEDSKRRREKEIREKERKLSACKVLIDGLGNKKQIIRFSTKNTGRTLFGKNIEIDDIANEVAMVSSGIDEAYKYSYFAY